MSERPNRPKGPSAMDKRRRARRLALQALYQWQMAGTSVSALEAEFVVDNDMAKVDRGYFGELLRGVVADVDDLDSALAPLVNRPLDDIDPIELALIRQGAYELKHRPDVPYRVAINEAVSLAKKFGGTDGHKFVNGVLDKLAPGYREAEVKAAQRDS